MLTTRFALVAVAACGVSAAPLPQTSKQPRLVVLMVLDQWPEWAFEAKRPALHGGGFDRLLSEGSWRVGRHPSAITATAPGHALISTGEPPATSGIVSNGWFRRELGRELQSVETED